MLSLSSGEAGATLYPKRGGLLGQFWVGGRPVLFLDTATLEDTTRKVRGGIPILFPAAGRLSGDRYLRQGKSFPLKQHGFARDLPWTVEDAEPATARLSLSSSRQTLAQFPFDFRLDFTFSVRASSLRIEQRYENRSPEPMPLHAGFHPYFLVPDAEKGKTEILTKATRAFDGVREQEVAVSRIDLTAPELSLHLVDHGAASAEIRSPSGTALIRASGEFGHWVVWTLGGRDFVCLEPWTAPADALNTGQKLLWVPPGEAKTLWIDIAAR